MSHKERPDLDPGPHLLRSMDRTIRNRVASVGVRAEKAASDEQLMARFRDGESSAFDQLLDRHKRAVYAYLRRSTRSAADADDLFQEVFLKVIRAAPKWQHEAKVTTWLYTIARNVLIDASRRIKTKPPPISLTDGEGDVERPRAPIEVLSNGKDPADARLLEQESTEAIERLVGALPAEQRDAFLLKREGLTFDEIATVTETSRNTIKSRLRYALEKIRAGASSNRDCWTTEPRPDDPGTEGWRLPDLQ